jgi:hypothetical protein
MSVTGRARALAAGSLSVWAHALRVAAGVAALAAKELRGHQAPAATDVPPGQADADTAGAAAGTSAGAGTQAAETVDLEDLLDRPVAQVVARLDGLGSVDLQRLLALEAAGRDRGSLLDAIERRLLPG